MTTETFPCQACCGGCNDSCRSSCPVVGNGSRSWLANNTAYFTRSQIGAPTGEIIWKQGYPQLIADCYYFWWNDFSRATNINPSSSLLGCYCYRERFRLFLVDCTNQSISDITSAAIESVSMQDPATGVGEPRQDAQVQYCFNPSYTNDESYYLCNLSASDVPAFYSDPVLQCSGACVYYQTLTACYQWSPSADDPNRVLIEGPCDECGDDCWAGYLGQETGFCVEKSSEQECLNAGGEEWLGHGSFTTECWYSECNDMYFLYRDCDPTGGGNPLP